VDGDSPAAQRYTEAKMQKIATSVLADIEKDTVDFKPNYDGQEIEPTVLPTRVPLMLLNGGMGIAVGMATDIAPHNLTEVVAGTKRLLHNPNTTIAELMEDIKGPDFPLGANAFNIKDIQKAYETGRGGVVVRGDAEIEEISAGATQIVITSIPYRVNKAVLVEKIAQLFKDKKLQGLRDLRDESTSDIRIVIELKRGTMAQSVLNTIYKNTPLEQKFNFNMVALVDGVPRTLNLKDILEEFIKFRKEVIRRATEFDLKKSEARAHILEGLKRALDHIDEIIALIKKSKDTAEAKVNLISKFKFSEIQAQAILDMKLQKLAGLERQKIEDELNSLLELIADLKDILAKPERVIQIIEEQLDEVVEKYGDERRTKIIPTAVGDFNPEDLIADEQNTLILTEQGYLKRTKPDEYKAQKRGGKGVSEMETKEDDVISEFITASTHSDILFFSSKGKVYRTKMYELPEGKRTTKGKFIANFLPLEENERITSVVALSKNQKENVDSLMMVTERGTIKKTEAKAFFEVRKNGLIAINLKDGDKLIDARFIKKDDTVILASSDGKAIHFKSSDIREMGRTAGGVRGMKLAKEDSIVSMAIIPKEEFENGVVIAISEKGFGKKTNIKDFKIQGRGGSGIKAMKVTDKTGRLVGLKLVKAEMSEIIAMSKNSQVIRTHLDQIPVLGRDTQGVRIMKLKKDNDTVVSFVLF